MCFLVYLAAERPLPTVAWNEAAPAFYVSPLGGDDWDRAIRETFVGRHVYEVGSHEGCGCGFHWKRHKSDIDELARDDETSESRRRLAKYLAGICWDGPVELYYCWEDWEALEPEHRRTISPERLLDVDFRIEDRTLLTIAEEAPAR